MAIGFAVVGLLLIVCGSLLVGFIPGDGQTGMIAFPLWLFGAILGIAAIVTCFSSLTPPQARLGVFVCAVLALASVVWSYFYGMRGSGKQPPTNGVHIKKE